MSSEGLLSDLSAIITLLPMCALYFSRSLRWFPDPICWRHIPQPFEKVWLRQVLCVDPPFWSRNHAKAVKLVRQAQNVISFQNVRFYVPFFPTDYIQRSQVAAGAFYENTILNHLASCIPVNAIILILARISAIMLSIGQQKAKHIRSMHLSQLCRHFYC
jgi:hypothetical protein